MGAVATNKELYESERSSVNKIVSTLDYSPGDKTWSRVNISQEGSIEEKE